MRKKIRKIDNQNGFTLIELMVVIAILGGLSAIAIPKFGNAVAAANTAKIQADLRTLDGAIVTFSTMENEDVPLGEIKANKLGKYLMTVPKPPSGEYLDNAGVKHLVKGLYLIVKFDTVDQTPRATLDGKTADQYAKK